MSTGPSELLSANAEFHGDLVRNIPRHPPLPVFTTSHRQSTADWAVAVAARRAGVFPTRAALATRPIRLRQCHQLQLRLQP